MTSTTPQAKPRVAASRWIKNHKAASITASVLTLALVAGGIFGVVKISEENAHESAFNTAHTSIKEYDTALRDSYAADASLVSAVTEARDYSAAVAALATAAASTLTEEQLVEVTAALSALDEAIVNASVQPEEGVEVDPEAAIEIETLSVPEADLLVRKAVTTDELRATASGINAVNDALEENTATRAAVSATVTTEVEKVETALLAAVATAPELSDAILTGAKSAGKSQKEAAATTLAALVAATEAGDDVLETATEYIAAVAALKTSHTAAVKAAAKKAAAEAAAAAQRSGAGSYVDPSTGQTVRTPSYNGGSSGGSSGGGLSTIPSGGPSWFEGSIACGGTGGSASGGGYATRVGVPAGSINVTSGYAQDSWWIRWGCDMDDDW
jgi:colicin import membrane protein